MWRIYIKMSKYLVIIDASEAMRGGYIDKVKKKVTADSQIMAAVKALKTIGTFKDNSISSIKSDLQSMGKGEYYIDGYGEVIVTKI